MLRFEEGVVLNRFPEVHERLIYAIGVLKVDIISSPLPPPESFLSGRRSKGGEIILRVEN